MERESTLTATDGRPVEQNEKQPRLGRIGFGILILIIAAAVAGYVPRWRQKKALVEEARDLGITSVSVTQPVAAKSSGALMVPAEIKPFLDAPIYARANGYLKRWLVDIGAEVQAGQLLAEIDTPEIQQELAQSRAQLLQAEAALELAKTTAARWADLLKTQSVSEQEEAEKRADLALKSATVEASKANVRRLEELEGFTRVTAPFAGTITARNTDVGELISANSGKELFHLAQTKTLRVFARVPQSAARAVRTGQLAHVLISEVPGEKFPAKVVRNAGVMSADSRTLLTELQLDNSRKRIMPGSFAQVSFEELHPDAPLTVPGNALIFRSEGSQVAIVENGVVHLKKITLGRDFGAHVEVLAGLTADDHVVTNPPDALTDGMHVRVVAPPAGEQGK